MTNQEILLRETLNFLVQLAGEVYSHLELGIESDKYDVESSKDELDNINEAIKNAHVLLKADSPIYIAVKGGVIQSICSSIPQTVHIYDKDLVDVTDSDSMYGTEDNWNTMISDSLKRNEIVSIYDL